jgi:AraC-like DNA-binding protein
VSAQPVAHVSEIKMPAARSHLFVCLSIEALGLKEIGINDAREQHADEKHLAEAAPLLVRNERERTQVICGFLGCSRAKNNPVISSLPALLKLKVEQAGAAEWIRSTFQYAASEVAAGRPGSETVLAKLSELLFAETVRRYVEMLSEATGWFAGLREPHVARALALLHREIARPWTVDELSREVGLSRSALADRFIRLLGTPPMHYLAGWRMQVAMEKLHTTSASLAQVAESVGYESEAAFSRAFKKAVGAAPATWRRSNTR